VAVGENLQAYRRIFVDFRPINEDEMGAALAAFGGVVGSWLGAWPLPLDWQGLWQQWPVACIVCGVGGHLLGIIIAPAASTRLIGG
jgi:GPI ethanolamine phosphate transferase 2/3 subunit F